MDYNCLVENCPVLDSIVAVRCMEGRILEKGTMAHLAEVEKMQKKQDEDKEQVEADKTVVDT